MMDFALDAGVTGEARVCSDWMRHSKGDDNQPRDMFSVRWDNGVRYGTLGAPECRNDRDHPSMIRIRLLILVENRMRPQHSRCLLG